MSLLVNYSDDNVGKFWKLYPQYNTIQPYKDLYKNDKSKGKTFSSKVMWSACILYERCDENPYARTPEDDKRIILLEELFDNKDFVWDDYTQVLDFFRDSHMTVVEKSILELENKIKNRDQFIMDVDYSLDEYEENAQGKWILKKGTADQLDKMLVQTDKIYALMDKLREQREKEITGLGDTKGNRRESAGEKKQL